METTDASLRSAAAGARRPGPSAGAVRILLVEDNRDVARVLSDLLTRSGHEVEPAGSIAEARRLAAEPGRFDLLISDLSLPDGSGLELMRQIGPIPGIAVSGYSTELDLRECLEAGFVDLLGKPIEFAALQEMILRITGSPEPGVSGPGRRRRHSGRGAG